MILLDLKVLKVLKILIMYHQRFWKMNFYQVERCYS